MDVKFNSIPECSNTKKKRYTILERKLRFFITKRNFISGITGLFGNTAKLLFCATEVVNNLVTAIKVHVLIISDIKFFTNALNKTAQNLENEDQNLSNIPAKLLPSSIEISTASLSASSCTISTAISQYTESITLSMLFFSETKKSLTM